MSLDWWSISVILRHSNQFTIHTSTYILFINCGIIFWGNCSNRGKIFTLQNKIINVMSGVQARTSYRGLFKQLEILPVSSVRHQCVLSIMNFIINNQENFQSDTSVHSINTRHKHHLIDCMLASKISTDYHIIWQCSRMTRQNLKEP